MSWCYILQINISTCEVNIDMQLREKTSNQHLFLRYIRCYGLYKLTTDKATNRSASPVINYFNYKETNNTVQTKAKKQ